MFKGDVGYRQEVENTIKKQVFFKFIKARKLNMIWLHNLHNIQVRNQIQAFFSILTPFYKYVLTPFSYFQIQHICNIINVHPCSVFLCVQPRVWAWFVQLAESRFTYSLQYLNYYHITLKRTEVMVWILYVIINAKLATYHFFNCPLGGRGGTDMQW